MVAKNPSPKQLPTAEYLHQCFSYDPESGVLTWKHRPLEHFKNAKEQRKWNGVYPGKAAGKVSRYVTVHIRPFYFSAHRLIFMMQTGKWPTRDIDHKNGNRVDNRWENLREATPQQNGWNRRHDRGLPKGVTISKNRTRTRYTVRIRTRGVQTHIGVFDTPEEAHSAWSAIAREERGEFFRPD